MIQVKLSHSVAQSTKAILQLIFIVALLVVALQCFVAEKISIPTLTTSAIVAAVTLGLALKLHYLRGEVPDHLRQVGGPYIECKGFCFLLSTRLEGGICFLDVLFQNRHENACIGRVILRPKRKMFRSQDPVAITVEVESPGGAFGRKSVPIPVEDTVRGKTLTLEMAAGVHYPDGRGRTLHYGEAKVHLPNKVSFSTPIKDAITVLALLGGGIFVHSPATIELPFPNDAPSTIPESIRPELAIEWKPENVA